MQHLLAPGIGLLVSFEAENTPRTEKMALTGEHLMEGLLQSGRLCRGASTPHRLADAFVHVDDRPCFHPITLTDIPCLRQALPEALSLGVHDRGEAQDRGCFLPPKATLPARGSQRLHSRVLPCCCKPAANLVPPAFARRSLPPVRAPAQRPRVPGTEKRTGRPCGLRQG